MEDIFQPTKHNSDEILTDDVMILAWRADTFQYATDIADSMLEN